MSESSGPPMPRTTTGSRQRTQSLHGDRHRQRAGLSCRPRPGLVKAVSHLRAWADSKDRQKRDKVQLRCNDNSLAADSFNLYYCVMIQWLPFLCLAVALAGCQPSAGPDENSDAKTEPSSAPDRLIFAFQRQKDPEALKEVTDALGQRLATELNMPVDVLVPTAYGATVQALVSNRAHVAYLSSLPFLLAEQETEVEVLLVEERGGKTRYDSVLVVAKGSPIRSLDDLRGKRMAFTSATSASGYVFPYAFFVEKGLIAKAAMPETFFSKTHFAGGYDQALRAVLRGQADVCAVSDYTMEGPTADSYLSAGERAGLRILGRIPGVPTHLITIRSDLPEKLKETIRETLLELSRTEPERFTDVYGAASFAAPIEDHVAPTRAALERTGLDRAAVVK